MLAKNPHLSAERLERTRHLMNEAVPDCLVTDYEEEIDALTLPDPDDRHVLAAAIQGGVDILATFNIADFPGETLDPFGIEAMHPDDFLVFLLDLACERFCSAVRSQRESLRHPPKLPRNCWPLSMPRASPEPSPVSDPLQPTCRFTGPPESAPTFRFRAARWDPRSGR